MYPGSSVSASSCPSTHVLLLELFSDSGVGTMITTHEEAAPA